MREPRLEVLPLRRRSTREWRVPEPTLPDTPGMPGVSAKTAWDFLPEGWSTELKTAEEVETPIEYSAGVGQVIFKQSDQTFRGVSFPSSFEPITQLEFAESESSLPRCSELQSVRIT